MGEAEEEGILASLFGVSHARSLLILAKAVVASLLAICRAPAVKPDDLERSGTVPGTVGCHPQSSRLQFIIP